MLLFSNSNFQFEKFKGKNINTKTTTTKNSHSQKEKGKFNNIARRNLINENVEFSQVMMMVDIQNEGIGRNREEKM